MLFPDRVVRTRHLSGMAKVSVRVFMGYFCRSFAYRGTGSKNRFFGGQIRWLNVQKRALKLSKSILKNRQPAVYAGSYLFLDFVLVDFVTQ